MQHAKYSVSVVTEPTTEPLLLDFVKGHPSIRVDGDHDDQWLDSLITAARQLAEKELMRRLVNTTLDYAWDCFPLGREPLEIPEAPLSSVTSVKYYDADDTEQTWSSANYNTDTSSIPGRIQPVEDEVWPTTRNKIAAVTVRAVVGYGSDGDSVPEQLKLALIRMVADWYDGTAAMDDVSITARRLMDFERWRTAAVV